MVPRSQPLVEIAGRVWTKGAAPSAGTYLAWKTTAPVSASVIVPSAWSGPTSSARSYARPNSHPAFCSLSILRAASLSPPQTLATIALSSK